MVAVVHAPHVERPHRVIPLHVTAGGLHPRDVFARRVERADAVEHHVPGDARATALCQRVHDLRTDLALLHVVLQVRDAAPRAADDAEDGREDLIAVEQDLDAVPLDDRRVGQRLDGGEVRGLAELHRPDRVVIVDAGAAGGGEEQAAQDDPRPHTMLWSNGRASRGRAEGAVD